MNCADGIPITEGTDMGSEKGRKGLAFLENMPHIAIIYIHDFIQSS